MSNVQYGSSAQGSVLRLFQLKNDHTDILAPKPSSSTFTDLDDAEFASKIIGDITITPQDDGSDEISFPVAEYSQQINDLLKSYKDITTADEKEEFTSWHGQKWGGGAEGSTANQLLLVIHGPLSRDSTPKRVVYVMPVVIVLTSGQHTLQANTTIQKTLTLRSIKAKSDITFHTPTTGPTVLDPDFVTIGSEATALDVAEGTYGGEFYLAPEA